MATELLPPPTVLRKLPMVLQSLLTGHRNLPTELQRPPMTPRHQTATTLQQSQTATTRHPADTKQGDESDRSSCPLKQGISTQTSTLPTPSTRTCLTSLSTTPLFQQLLRSLGIFRFSTRPKTEHFDATRLGALAFDWFQCLGSIFVFLTHNGTLPCGA